MARMVRDLIENETVELVDVNDWIFIDHMWGKVEIENRWTGKRMKLHLGDALLAGIEVPGIDRMIGS